MGHVTVNNEDGTVSTYFGEEDVPAPKKQAEAKVVEPGEKPAAKTRSRASSK